ncbi:MAG TPA: flagellar basal body rod protein FlgB [Pseudolabrys sp.]|jgi:flagellar basal-body rod protein FlgB
MAITDIPIFSMLRTKLQYSQERQRVLSENVANADTPNYRAKDLKAPKFPDPTQITPATVSNVSLARTENGHFAQLGGTSSFSTDRQNSYEVRPTGTAVNLEDEMIKVADNQVDYQTASALYTRSLGLIKVALGKR